eukprot:scaffold384890_cov18-Prasinocladus_malaysianus.AAC.1
MPASADTHEGLVCQQLNTAICFSSPFITSEHVRLQSWVRDQFFLPHNFRCIFPVDEKGVIDVQEDQTSATAYSHNHSSSN